MNRQPEDREWDRVVECVELDIRTEDLAAAEQAMEEAGEQDTEPVSSAWVDATVARVAQEVAAARGPVALASKPVLGVGWWDGVKRFAAALLALLGIQSAASAAVVGAASVTVVAVVVVLVWESGQDSNHTLPYRLALDLILSSDQSEGDRLAAVKQVARRAKAVIDALRVERDSVAADAGVRTAAAAALVTLASLLDRSSSAPVTDVPDTLEQSLVAMADAALDQSVRLHELEKCAAVASVAISGMLALPEPTPALAAYTSNLLQKLQQAVHQ